MPRPKWPLWGGSGPSSISKDLLETDARHPASRLFSESPSGSCWKSFRTDLPEIQSLFGSEIPWAVIGAMTSSNRAAVIRNDRSTLIDSSVESLAEAWKPPLHAPV